MNQNQNRGCCGDEGCACGTNTGLAGECRCGETCRCSACQCGSRSDRAVSADPSAAGSTDAS